MNQTKQTFPEISCDCIKTLLMFYWKSLEVQLFHWRIGLAAKLISSIFLVCLKSARFKPHIYFRGLCWEGNDQLFISLGSQIVELELSHCNGFFNLFKRALELRSAVKLVNLNCFDSENVSSSWNKIVLKTTNLIEINYITK